MRRAGALVGCFGLQEYFPVMRVRTLQAAGESAWAAGRDLNFIFLMPLGFRGDGRVAERSVSPPHGCDATAPWARHPS